MNKKYVFITFFILLLVVTSSLFVTIISPFLIDIFLAVIFTHLFLPIKKTLSNKLHPNIAGLLTVTSIFFIVIIPLFVITLMVTSEISAMYSSFIESWPSILQQIKSHEYYSYRSQIPIIGSGISDDTIIELVKNVGQSVGSVAKYSFAFAKSFVINISSVLAHFLFTMLITYYFLISHDSIKQFVRKTIPLDNKDIDEIYQELENTGDATINGTFVIGIIEGVFGALLLTFVGTESTVLWGVLMFFLSMIPLIGITVVLIPFALFYILSGDVASGIVIIIVGVSGVTFTQNILKPKLVGDRSGLHQGIVLISSIGGISTFGIIGFIIGPLIATMFFVIWKQFRVKYENR